MTMNIGPYLAVDEQGFFCQKCGQRLGARNDNYKLHTLSKERPLTTAGDKFPTPDRGPFVLREFCCPGCAVRFDAEITRPESPPVWDIQFDA